MESRRLKKSVIVGIYSMCIVALIGTIYLIESNISKDNFKDDDYTYVSKTIVDDSVQVIAETDKIVKPYTDTELKILKNFYDYQGEEESQQNSIFVYDNTYLQSSGISYGGKDSFDVVSVLGGTVLDVKEDKLLGKIIEIKHNNDVISIYQCLSETSVKKDDTITTGQIIGKGGTCNINNESGTQVYFELLNKGIAVNPESYYGKTISEL